MDINSNDYWNKRFTEDWNEYGGAEQSRYFAHIIVDALPEWLKVLIRESDNSVCDWGCAQGDGTDVFTSTFKKTVLGIDFSPVAIENAKNRYPTSDFSHINLLDDSSEIDFHTDIMFCSNTLEHFHKPFQVLKKLKQFTKNLIIISVPFEEIDRINEHHFTFLDSNIPIHIGNNWSLLLSKIVNCKDHINSYWQGKQIILVYCNEEWCIRKNIQLSNVSPLSPLELSYYLNIHKKQELQITALNEKIAELNEIKNKNENELIMLHAEPLFKSVIRRIKKRL